MSTFRILCLLCFWPRHKMFVSCCQVPVLFVRVVVFSTFLLGPFKEDIKLGFLVNFTEFNWNFSIQTEHFFFSNEHVFASLPLKLRTTWCTSCLGTLQSLIKRLTRLFPSLLIVFFSSPVRPRLCGWYSTFLDVFFLKYTRECLDSFP